MMLKAGLVQTGAHGDAAAHDPERLKRAMVDAHWPYVEAAARAGVQVLGLQELYNLPYFCASLDRRWYAAAEPVPDGPGTAAMQAAAREFGMVIVAPVFEEAMPGQYFNTAAVIDADGRFLGKFRKIHIPNIPDFHEKLFFTPGDLGYPVFQTAFCRLGVYICYDRHFPEGWRQLALNGAELVLNPSATGRGLSDHLWEIEQPAAAVANGIFIGTSNRVGWEAPWRTTQFYGGSYFCDPKGRIVAQAPYDAPGLVVADLDLGLIREVRESWQFFRDRRPDTYGGLCRIGGDTGDGR